MTCENHLPETLSSLWANHSRRRLAWAETAYGTFLATIDPELARQYRQHSDEVTVVIFGKTQVGKTTLILTLLGVAPVHLGLVSSVLRGGRPMGRSATSTAILYSRSLDENWHLVIDGYSSRFDSAASMEERIGLVRAEMESGTLRLKRPIQVLLPAVFFMADSSTERSVNIIDLPGDSPTNEREQEHVNEIAGKYIPNADLVLLVGKADDLGFIDPAKLPLPGLGDWRYNPGRYRIITTYTIQAASFRDWLRQQTAMNTFTVRERLLKQLTTFDEVVLSEDALDPALYYPLEFGESWFRLEALDPGMYAQVKPVMEQLFGELKQDIQRSASPYMRLWRASQVAVVASRLRRARHIEYEAHIQEILNESANLEKMANSLASAAAWIKQDASNLPTPERIRDFKTDLRDSITDRSRSTHWIPDEVKSKVSELLRLLHESVDDLIRTGMLYEPDSLGELRFSDHVPAPNVIRSWIEPHFLSLWQRLHAYTFDNYQPWVFKSFNRDLSDLRRLSTLGLEVLHAALYHYWESVISELSRDFENQRTQLINRAESAERDACAHRTKSVSLLTLIEDKRQDLRDFSARMERDEDTGRRFVSTLLEAFYRQVSDIRNAISKTKSPAAKFILLLARRQLEDEKDYVFSLGTSHKELSR